MRMSMNISTKLLVNVLIDVPSLYVQYLKKRFRRHQYLSVEEISVDR